jgi:TFIIF-interacting CTD phosphatase-like protein
VVFAKLLVLDLDETLVHANDEPKLPRPAEFRVGPYGVLRRPGVEAFLEFALEHFEHVGVWTASTLSYALPVLEHIVVPKRLTFVWGRERCTYQIDLEAHKVHYLKDIRKLTRGGKFRKERLLFVDDSPKNLARSYGNLIPIRPFEGDPNDHELQLLEQYLRSIGDVDNVRTIEKRAWRAGI